MTNRSVDALVALRQIQRKVEVATRKLSRETNLSPSQLRVLEILVEKNRCTLGEIAKETQLSNATITALIDKMESRGLVIRVRGHEDRRRVWLELTPAGRQSAEDAPTSLQNIFETRFANLESWEQAMLVAALEKVASILDAENLPVGAILTVDEIAAKVEDTEI